MDYLNLIRAYQWIKNVLIFVPMLAIHEFSRDILILNIYAFVAFSLVSSSVYILNDISDIKSDKLHPRKKLRPIPAGKISITKGKIISILLLLIGLLISYRINMNLLILLVLYFTLSNLYSLIFKQKIILDITILSLLYTMRIIAGGLILNVMPSVWILAFSIFFFFSLASIKRQAELIDIIKRKKVFTKGRGYSSTDLSILTISALSSGYVSVLIMAFYVNSAGIVKLYAEPVALWGICIVLLYWITRLVMLTNRGMMKDDPIIFAIKDIGSLICLTVILFLILFAI